MEHLVILHTNDIHSHLENWPRIRRYLINERKQLQQKGDQILVFDAGDAVDRWHPLTEATNGQANVKLLNQVHYDAVTIGNNEGIDNNHYHLNHLYDHANFPIVLDNLIDPHTNQIPKWAQPYKIIITKNKTKIGVVGLTIPYQDGYTPLHWCAQSISESVPPLLDRIKDKCNILILISHLGFTKDQYIARNYPEFNIIIGGHSHILLPRGEHDNHSLLVATSKYGHYIGQVDVWLSHHKIVKDKASVIEVNKLASKPTDDSEIKRYVSKGNRLLRDNEIAKLPMSLNELLGTKVPSF